MMDLYPLIIALLAGLSIGFMLYTLILAAAARSDLSREVGPGEAAFVHLWAALDLVPVPISVQRAWGSEATSERILQAGLDWSGYQYVAFRWVVSWLLAIAALLIAISRAWDLLGVFLLAVIVMFGWVFPEVWLRRRIEARRLEVDLALPDFLDRLALGLEAGLGFEIALRRTSRNFPGLLGEELRYVVRQLNRGHARSAELDRMLGRIPSSDLGAFVAAVKQTDRLGTSLARTLQVQKALMRSRRRRRAEEASRRLPILIVFPLVFFFLPALLIIYLAPPMLHLFLGQ